MAFGRGVACKLKLNGNRSLKGSKIAKMLKLPSGGLHVKHAVLTRSHIRKLRRAMYQKSASSDNSRIKEAGPHRWQASASLISPYGLNFIKILYKKPVRTSQETHHVFAPESNGLILYGETVAVCCENSTDHTDALCGQNAEFCSVDPYGTYTNHGTFNG
jgi:hypothetical protein